MTSILQETKAPEGYLLDSSVYPFEITKGGEVVTVETEAGTGCFINQKIYGNVQTTKVDELYPDNKLTGATFVVYEDTNGNGKLDGQEENTAKPMTETETGVYSLTHIPYGAYLMKETQAPENYVLDENVYSFSIVEDGKTVIVENQAGTGCFINQPMGYIAIQKNTVNTEDNISKPEQNAEFQVFLTSAGSYDQADDAHRDLLVTDKNGFAVSKILPAGTYTVHQVKGTDGTKLAEDFTVEVKDAGKTYSYALNNEYFLASLKLLKHEKNTDILLEGATYGLYDGEQNLLETGVTEEDGSLTFAHHLVYGLNYFIREEEAPLGYECDTEFKPVPTPDWTNGATEIPVLVMELEDKPQEGRIQVNKVDTGRNPMDGVSFLLEYSTDGKSWNPVFFREGEDVVVGGCTSEGLQDGVLKTDLDGTLTFTGLRLTCQTGEVHYRLTEVATKAGNTLLSEPAFEGTLPQERDAEGAENATEVRGGVAYYNDITVTVVNNPNYEIPMTGGTNAILLPLTGVLILLCGITVAFFATKKRKA